MKALKKMYISTYILLPIEIYKDIFIAVKKEMVKFCKYLQVPQKKHKKNNEKKRNIFYSNVSTLKR